jgi:hypothetical protein
MTAVVFCLFLAFLIAIGWHFIGLDRNRGRAIAAMRWVDLALAAEGHVTGFEAVAPERYSVTMQFDAAPFHRPAIWLELAPRHDPLRWLIFKLQKQEELLIFQTDLDLPLNFSFEGINERWLGRSRRGLTFKHGNWDLESWTPCIISTRNTWRSELSSVMNALFSSRHHEVLSVHFQRSSPNFSASLPLSSLQLSSEQRPSFFDSLRELASEASAPRS